MPFFFRGSFRFRMKSIRPLASKSRHYSDFWGHRHSGFLGRRRRIPTVAAHRVSSFPAGSPTPNKAGFSFLLTFRRFGRNRCCEGSLLTPGESGMSRQSNEYTKSPFEVFPIGKHNTGLPTLSIGGAGARLGVCANAGDERSTSAKDDFFISTSRSAYYTTVLPYCIPLTRTVVLLGNISSDFRHHLNGSAYTQPAVVCLVRT